MTAKQSSVYLEDDLKREIKILVANNPEKWVNMSAFLREAAREKLEKEARGQVDIYEAIKKAQKNDR